MRWTCERESHGASNHGYNCGAHAPVCNIGLRLCHSVHRPLKISMSFNKKLHEIPTLLDLMGDLTFRMLPFCNARRDMPISFERPGGCLIQ